MVSLQRPDNALLERQGSFGLDIGCLAKLFSPFEFRFKFPASDFEFGSGVSGVGFSPAGRQAPCPGSHAPGVKGAGASTQVLYPDSSVHIMATLVFVNRVLQNKHQAVSQGVRRYGKRSPPEADEHLQ